MDQRVDAIDTAGDNRARQGRVWRLDPLRSHPRLVAAVALAIIAAGALAIAWWVHASGYVSTDDAFIDVHFAEISPQISAAIVEVPVTDNQSVSAGTPLVRLDDRDFVAQRDQTAAQVQQAQASIDNLTAQIAAQNARIDQAKKLTAQAQAGMTFAQQEYSRYETLAKQGSGTVEQAQQYSSSLKQNEASLAAAEANTVATEKQVPVLEAQRQQYQAQLDQARASLDQAETNLRRTIITAPEDGRVTNLTAATGSYAAIGQPLMVFVPRAVWITANFKETELSRIRPGMPVDIQVDAYPGRTFKGHVDSIQAGSGVAFSLLPSENATGNYVKIVQRVPVKILFNAPPDVLLGPGMSVVPTVNVR